MKGGKVLSLFGDRQTTSASYPPLNLGAYSIRKGKTRDRSNVSMSAGGKLEAISWRKV